MATEKDLKAEIAEIFKTNWEKREGRQVPSAEDVALGNDAVAIEGTVLYADLVDSTSLVTGYQNWFAAEVYKAYLVTACRIISDQGGDITAFDGDRVMAVFMGD